MVPASFGVKPVGQVLSHQRELKMTVLKFLGDPDITPQHHPPGLYYPQLRATLSHPQSCPKYRGYMKIIAFIEQSEITEKILKHLGLWNLKKRSPPKIHSPLSEDYSYFQIPR